VNKLTVYYNSACPVCNAGISAEKRRMEACAVDAEWIDVHQKPEALQQIGATQEFVRERLHVMDDTGKLHVGAAAIAALWSKTAPRQRLAAFIRLPFIRVLADSSYNAFAAALYRWNRWLGRW
jgi:predicted DCC family thiol-disulfide oxidoreductase YuxK